MAAIRGTIAQGVNPLDQIADPGDTFKNPAQAEFVRVFLKTLREVLDGVISRDRATSFFYLQSPNGMGWKVTVSDAGELTVAPARQ